jgi:oxygen-independent coproporphyrinogen-3 oxidase
MTMTGVEIWLKAVQEEIRHWGKALHRPKMETVYIGGGSPSLLPAYAFTALMKALKTAFVLPEGIEFSMEANPESATDQDLIKTWRKAGVNRVSLGVQSFDPAELTQLGRPHGPVEVSAAVERIRAAGIANLSLDLLWGLPGQRLKSWLDNLKAAVRLGPEHLSCYGLTLEPGTPMAANQAGFDWPPESEQAKMYLYGGDYLEAQGYLQYEISNFARMGYSCRHNQGYWEGRDYLGLGPSAVSTMAGERWENPKTVEAYAAMADRRGFGDGRVELTSQERVREILMLAMRTAKGMKLSQYKKLTGLDLPTKYPKLLAALRQEGLIRIKNGSLVLTRPGMLVSNVIMGRFLFPEDS